MNKYIISASLSGIAFLLISVGFAGQVHAFDPFRPNGVNTVCDQSSSDGASSVCSTDGSDPLTGNDGVLTKAVNILAFITGIAAVLAIIIGGFEYVRSGGESSKVNKAKNTILFAVIGLVVVVVARSLVLLVINRL